MVGLRGGWHTAGTMAGVFNRLHAKRLAQAAEVIIELRAQGAPPARLVDGSGVCIPCLRLAQATEVTNERAEGALAPAHTARCTVAPARSLHAFKEECRQESQRVNAAKSLLRDSTCCQPPVKAWAMPAPQALCAGL